MEKVSILIPTRQRYKKLKKCIDKLFENTIYPNYEIVIIVDKDDVASLLLAHEIEMSHTKQMKMTDLLLTG